MRQSRKSLFFALFFLSGFSGLIYQSIWSHYLKLFLGHAAYAQTLVLAIFMGGMAVGSLLSGLLTPRWKKLLIGYAVVEGIIGFLAIIFHSVFIGATDYTFTHLLSGIGDNSSKIVLLKWGVASLLIFPQSVLLGMTFPLMVGGILRHFPKYPGHTLSMLYFTNSFGAVFGVLASSFFLIGSFGLPGTMLTAGLMNIFLALIVWGLAKNHPEPLSPIATEPVSTAKADVPVLPSVLLLIALLTGLSSFMYEIGWIRMLVLVLGGSTHSFELMLGSFILGLALGGFWIRNRIDKIKDPLAFLGFVQIAMALSAVLSVWMYHYSFDLMSFILSAIQRKDETYPLYLVLSGLIAVVLMLPTTFCAGMTLPLITRLIIKTKKREKGIGYVYSANTLGAIVGIFLSVHVVLPMLGLKNLIGIGAAVDLLLGLYLIRFTPARYFNWSNKGSTAVAAVMGLFALSFFAVQFDDVRMSSGVFRHGNTESADKILYHQDGKTSTVTVSQFGTIRSLKNNGKPDASIQMDENAESSADEGTQVLLSAIPLFHLPEAKQAAIIGMGSGMSTHVMLGSPNLEVVDTIEMEAKVYEASKLFLPVVDYAYNDPRSRLHTEDAKTFFSTHDKQYDIIMSEPPNPWVSGVSTLFSQEFYQRVKKHLAPNGIFAQWIQLYQIDVDLVSTVFNALGTEFDDYVVYRAGNGNLVIIASASGKLPSVRDTAMGFPDLKPMLERIDVANFQDITQNRIGTKTILAPLFQSINGGVNSDYFPILDGGAPRARFAAASAEQLTDLLDSSIPVLKILDPRAETDSSRYSLNVSLKAPKEKRSLLQLRDEILGIANPYTGNDTARLSTSLSAHVLKSSMASCDSRSSLIALKYLTKHGVRISAMLSQAEQQPLWDYFATTNCISGPHSDELITQWHGLLDAINKRDYTKMSRLSTSLLDSEDYPGKSGKFQYTLSMGLLADIKLGESPSAHSRWEKYNEIFVSESQVSLPLQLVLSNIEERVQLTEAETEQ